MPWCGEPGGRVTISLVADALASSFTIWVVRIRFLEVAGHN